MDLLSFYEHVIEWAKQDNTTALATILGVLTGFLTLIGILFRIIIRPFFPKLSHGEQTQIGSVQSAEEIARAAISSYEQGRQSLGGGWDLQQRDQQIIALMQAVEALLEVQREAGSSSEQATIENALAHLEQGKTAEAEEIFESILQQKFAQGHMDNIEAATAARHIGALAYLHDSDKALTAYRKATELNPENAEGWNRLGQIQKRIGELDQAIVSFEKVLTLGNHRGDEPVVAAALNNLGLIYQTRGNLEQAEQLQLKSLELHERLGNKLGMANGYGNLGLLYQTQGELNQAKQAQLQALALDEQLGNKQGMANTYSNLGVIYKNQGDLQLAEEIQLKSLALQQQLENKEGLANSYGNLGIIYQIRGDLDLAEQAQLKSLELQEQLGNKQGMAAIYGNLGGFYQQKGQIEEACAHWHKALNLYQEVDIPPMIELVTGWLKEAGCSECKKQT